MNPVPLSYRQYSGIGHQVLLQSIRLPGLELCINKNEYIILGWNCSTTNLNFITIVPVHTLLNISGFEKKKQNNLNTLSLHVIILTKYH